MLKDIENTERNSIMEVTNLPEQPSKDGLSKLKIHHTNMYQPNPASITCLNITANQTKLACRRGFLGEHVINHPFSLLDLFEIESNIRLRHYATITEYEDIHGLAWTNKKYLLAVSGQSTINIYNVKTTEKVKVLTTDYGPIMSMRYLQSYRLLLTGTALGFIVSYKIGEDGRSIEFLDKLHKINEPIICLDFFCEPRDIQKCKPVKVHAKKLQKKRKRDAESSESDESGDEEVSTIDSKSIEALDITIYGANKQNVTVWDYHRKIIMDTIRNEFDVLAVRTLLNGDVVIGDLEGRLGIYDKNNLACRQNEQIFDDAIMCIDVSKSNSQIIAAGESSFIAILQKSAKARDEYSLFERLSEHTGPISCLNFLSKEQFLSASYDSQLINYRFDYSPGRKTLLRHSFRVAESSKICVHGREIALMYGKSFLIYPLKTDEDIAQDKISYPHQVDLQVPVKNFSLRVGKYLHSATFSSRWICYSTHQGLFIHSRSNIKTRSTTSCPLQDCHLLRLTQDDRYLVACQREKIFVVKLGESTGETKEYEVLFGLKTKGYIRDVTHVLRTNKLFALCGPANGNRLYQFRLPNENDEQDVKVRLVSRINLPEPVIQMSFNRFDVNDVFIYIYTSLNRFIKCDSTQPSGGEGGSSAYEKYWNKLIKKQKPIEGLAADIDISGFVLISDTHCILHDDRRVFKVDLNKNEVVNKNEDYSGISLMSNNLTTTEPNELLIISSAA